METEKNNKKARARFAPSPTGYLHVGGIRTALFAWLVARQSRGVFILRLEDTDRNRNVPGSAEHLIKSLRSLGLEYDEGPDIGGPFAPYRQSERLTKYKEWAQKLIDNGRAYADPYTAEEVQAFREQAQKDKQPFLYRNHRPENPPTWDGTKPLRFKSEPKAYSWHDEVMGDLNTGPEVIDDLILIKSDGYPTYNFAHICDDADMEITHIIRGQEFIASTPNYLNLYEALGLTPPIMATVPHIMGPDGKKKLSKRDGAKDVLDYIKDGILPDALVNFIASLGWNDGTEQEIFTRKELIQKFSLSRVQRSGAKFDEQRLLWVNGQHIRSLSLDDLSQRAQSFWPSESKQATEDYKRQVLALVQDRLKTLSDLPLLTKYFFADPTPNWSMIEANKQLKKLSKDELQHLLKATYDKLVTTDFNMDDLTDALNALLAQTGQKPAILFSIIRFALTWAPFSPGLAETMLVLGKENTLERLHKNT
ncbi:MAG TPA: glutamate--tRNA ligase [Patescibacteria group bacterium]|jgi:glutamyl-tRNA synthetase|nr:glutamate--tRNA ligase [Patescibacteria group bacterium]